MADGNNSEASANTAPAPSLTDLLHFSGLSPSRWGHLSDIERADWTRRYIASGIAPGAVEREQGRGGRAK
jgi:hypothetical protein